MHEGCQVGCLVGGASCGNIHSVVYIVFYFIIDQRFFCREVASGGIVNMLAQPFLNEEKGREHGGAKYDSSENSDNS